MTNSYIFPKNNLPLLSPPPIISFMYTEIEDDPSLIHSHPYTEILIPKNEYGLLSCNKEEISIKHHNLYIIPPNISHTEINTHAFHSFKYYTIKLQDLIISPKQENSNLIVLNLNDSHSEIHSYLSWALIHLIQQDNEQLISLNLTAFFNKLIQILNKENYLLNKNTTNRASTFVQECANFLSQNYEKQIIIEDFAAQHGISYSSFTKKFRKHFKMSPKEYLIKKRIEVAKYLLFSSDHTISQISSSCGFSSPAYFTFYFRKLEGMTPKEYRNRDTKSVN